MPFFNWFDHLLIEAWLEQLEQRQAERRRLRAQRRRELAATAKNRRLERLEVAVIEPSRCRG